MNYTLTHEVWWWWYDDDMSLWFYEFIDITPSKEIVRGSHNRPPLEYVLAKGSITPYEDSIQIFI